MICRFAGFFGVFLALAKISGAAAAETPKVVVTIKPIHSLVSRIMDGVGEPQLIVEGSASPHTFTLKPSTARAIHDADVFVRVSDQLEPFTRKIVTSLPSNVTVLTLAGADGVTLLDQRQGGTFEKHEHGHEEAAGKAEDHDDHDEDGKDGHIWLDPQNAKAIVTDVAKTLEARYPEHADKIKANTAALISDLDALDNQLTTELKASTGKPFIVFHDATQYFEHHFGQKAAGSITVSPDVPPSAKRLTEVRRKLSSLGAVCVFTEPNFQPNLVAAVTEGTHARSGTIDAEGQMLTPGPGLYFDLMRGVAHSISNCLNGQS
ncbi:zinc ABC transporter substrate-binding protein [Hyphomicrobium sp. 99]|uniref:zinc ABC transporter substrate-binding protein n=1 Tax=Hyphomicrobium sp. 99 TaxID=1163419 RepID=UPI0005F7B13F|nr:zinc ABC transporter substrate-binding protein [Hyphomicrobium sp. 99]